MTRQRVLVYLLCILLILFVYLVTKYFQCQLSDLPPVNESSVSSPIQQCQSVPLKKIRTNIFFLKTHKTASTTIFSILVRFCLRHSLNFMLPKQYDVKTDWHFGYNRAITLEDMNSEIMPLDNKFNIFALHSRYRRETNEFLYPDVKRVTVLRSPPERFESDFGFSQLDVKLRTSWSAFVQSIGKAAKRPISRAITGFRNKMSRELGLDESQVENEQEIAKFIRFADEEFHLVMITEHLEASLVLLADLMSWPLHYVASIGVHIRPDAARSRISDEDRRAILQHNRADHLLYEHFLAVFRRRVLEYGFERMAADMERLRRFDRELREHCRSSNRSDVWFGGEMKQTTVATARECFLMTQDESAVLNILNEEQTSRLGPIKRLQNLIASTRAP